MSTPRILVVEGGQPPGGDLCLCLTQLGYVPAGRATRGDQAITMAGELRPDLVLMDLHLEGGMDAIDAAMAIRRVTAVPVIFLSPRSEDASIERAKMAEPAGFVFKPFESRDLRVSIELALCKRRAEEAVRTSEAQLLGILNNLDGLVYVADMQTYETLFVNTYGRQVWGDFTGKCCWQSLQAGQTGPCSFCTNSRLLNPDGTPGGVIVWEFQNTVTKRWYECRDSAIRWPDGRTVRLEIATDITNRMRMEECARQAQKMEAVSHLAAGVAHEFNNILAALTLNLEMTRLMVGNPEAQDLMAEMTKLSRRAANVVSQLLAFSRQSTIRPEPLDLAAVIAGQAGMLRRLLGENIRLELCLAAGETWVNADRSSIEQVLVHLCLNARQAMKAGGFLIVRLSNKDVSAETCMMHESAKPGRFVCMEVADTGCGMDSATKNRLFEPFFTTRDVGQGAGLGLATVRGLIEQQQGWVEAESEVGRGSTFRVYLPAVTQPSPAAQTAPKPTPARGVGTILLVEDDAALRRVEERLLRGNGYTVFVAADGSEGLALWAQHQASIDLVLTDRSMPGALSGLGLAERALADKPGVRVIIMSGLAVEPPDAQSRSLPITQLSKPCPTESLLRTIQEELRQR